MTIGIQTQIPNFGQNTLRVQTHWQIEYIYFARCFFYFLQLMT